MPESKTVSIWLEEPLIDEIDSRRPSTTSRTEWIKAAIQARLDAEDEGEWTDPDRAVADGGEEG